VDRSAWISTFEEALAKAIVQIVLSRQAEQASQAVGSGGFFHKLSAKRSSSTIVSAAGQWFPRSEWIHIRLAIVEALDGFNDLLPD